MALFVSDIGRVNTLSAFFADPMMFAAFLTQWADFFVWVLDVN